MHFNPNLNVFSHFRIKYEEDTNLVMRIHLLCFISKCIKIFLQYLLKIYLSKDKKIIKLLILLNKFIRCNLFFFNTFFPYYKIVFN